MNRGTIRILIAEDQKLVLGALSALLRLEPDFAVVAAATNGKEALALCEQFGPDIVLTDIEMPHMTGIELAQALGQRKLACRVVVVTTFARSGYLRRAMEAGVRGYLLKDAPVDALAVAIRAVYGGGKAIAPELALASWNGPPPPGAAPAVRARSAGRCRHSSFPGPARAQSRARRRAPRGWPRPAPRPAHP